MGCTLEIDLAPLFAFMAAADQVMMTLRVRSRTMALSVTIRRAIQHSQASLRTLSKRYGINQKTAAKWRQRTSAADRRTGPKDLRSSALSLKDEAVLVAFRRHALLPLDGCLYMRQDTIPHLTRSSLHCCLLARHQHRTGLLRRDRVAVHRAEPTQPHQLSNAASVLLFGFHRHGLEGCAHVAGLR